MLDMRSYDQNRGAVSGLAGAGVLMRSGVAGLDTTGGRIAFAWPLFGSAECGTQAGEAKRLSNPQQHQTSQ